MQREMLSEASKNWDVYIKECMDVAATSITPYKIIPYAKNKGIKQAVVEKQTKTAAQMIKKINLMYRRLMFKFSKQDIKAVLKYDPLNLLQ